jgi:hypothetical protein
VRPTAEFFTKPWHFYGPDFLTILFPEESQRPTLEGVLQAHQGCLHRGIGPDVVVDQIFHAVYLTLTETGKMRKVKAQPVWCDQRAGLFHVVTQDLSQGRMQQVRGRVVFANGLAPDPVDFEVHGHFTLYGATPDDTVMHDEVRQRFLRIGDLHFDAVLGSDSPASIANLPAGLAVERRVLKH